LWNKSIKGACFLGIIVHRFRSCISLFLIVEWWL